MPPGVPNTWATILQVGSQMWIVNDLAGKGNMQCVCTNPSGQHCTNERPCYSYLWRWNTFETAQYLGREKIGVEWIQNHGVGNSSKIMDWIISSCGRTTCGQTQSLVAWSARGNL